MCQAFSQGVHTSDVSVVNSGSKVVITDVSSLNSLTTAEVASLTMEPTAEVPGILNSSGGWRLLLASTRLAVERSKMEEGLEIFIFLSYRVLVQGLLRCEIIAIYIIGTIGWRR